MCPSADLLYWEHSGLPLPLHQLSLSHHDLQRQLPAPSGELVSSNPPHAAPKAGWPGLPLPRTDGSPER